jgi:hypothetical protein
MLFLSLAQDHAQNQFVLRRSAQCDILSQQLLTPHACAFSVSVHQAPTSSDEAVARMLQEEDTFTDAPTSAPTAVSVASVRCCFPMCCW